MRRWQRICLVTWLSLWNVWWSATCLIYLLHGTSRRTNWTNKRPHLVPLMSPLCTSFLLIAEEINSATSYFIFIFGPSPGDHVDCKKETHSESIINGTIAAASGRTQHPGKGRLQLVVMKLHILAPGSLYYRAGYARLTERQRSQPWSCRAPGRMGQSKKTPNKKINSSGFDPEPGIQGHSTDYT
jgi:hypothetical protein